MNYAASLPEGGLLHPKALLHLGSRAAIDQALSRLAKQGKLMRVCHGIYVLPVETGFGDRAPALDKVLASLSALWGETIVPCGGTAAKRSRPDHTGTGPFGLSDIRAKSQADAGRLDCGVASRPTMATSRAGPSGGRGAPCPVMGWGLRKWKRV